MSQVLTDLYPPRPPSQKGEMDAGFMLHLVLVVEESVDARPGAGVPDLHALVRRADRTESMF